MNPSFGASLAPGLSFLRPALLLALALLALAPAASAASRDMELTGSHGLQGRSAYQPVIQQQAGKWIAYVGHHAGHAINPLTGRDEQSGTSILDVTDPARPQLLHHLPGSGGGAQMARVCKGDHFGAAHAGRTYLLRTLGDEAHETWDVSDPARPRRLARIGPVAGTHKNFWECDTGIAYLVSGAAGWRTGRMTQIYDLSDPARPVFIRNFGLVGQEPGARGPVPTGLHGAISTGPAGNRVYFGYGTNRDGVMQVVDRRKLLEGGRRDTAADLLAPQVGRLDMTAHAGAHTTFPILGMEVEEFKRDASRARDFVLVVSESLASNCGEARQMAWMADVSSEERPQFISSFTVREAHGDFCRKPGRFGTHSSNESMAPVYYRRLVFLAHFNAGVRVVDVRNPYALKEVAWFIPDAAGCAACGTPQTNNVEVDERGYIYITDRAGHGLHVLKLTGAASAIADFSQRR